MLTGQMDADIATRGRRVTAVLVGLFAAYLVLMVWLVLWKFHVPFIGRDDMREIKLIPFIASGDFGASAPYEVLANFLLFLPFGIYLRALAPAWPRWRVVGILAASSLVLEVLEYITAVGSSDITDVIVNTAGGLAGVAVVALVRRRRPSSVAAIFARVLAVATAVALIVVALHIASFPKIPPPHDDGSPTIVE